MEGADSSMSKKDDVDDCTKETGALGDAADRTEDEGLSNDEQGLGSSQKRARQEGENDQPASSRPRVGEPTAPGQETDASAAGANVGGGGPFPPARTEPPTDPDAGGVPVYPSMPPGMAPNQSMAASFLTAQTRAALAMGIGPGFAMPGQLPMGYGAPHGSVESFYQGQGQLDASAVGNTLEESRGGGSNGQQQDDVSKVEGEGSKETSERPVPDAASQETQPRMPGPTGFSSPSPLMASMPWQQMMGMPPMMGALPSSPGGFPNAAFFAASQAQMARAAAGFPPFMGAGMGYPMMPVSNAIPLSLTIDAEHLSDYQILIRKQLELFEATQDDIESNMQGRKKSIKVGQVGLRCRHCAHSPLRNRGRGAVYYPTRLQGVYQAAQNMSSSHLIDSCNVIDDSMKTEMRRLRERRDTASGGKQYWADGARALGLYETDDGRLRLRRGNESAT